MPIALSEEQHRQRVLNLIGQLSAINETVKKIATRISGLSRVYPHSQYGSKAKIIRAQAQKEYLSHIKELKQKQAVVIEEIKRHQKNMKNPIVNFTHKKNEES